MRDPLTWRICAVSRCTCC